MGNKAHDTIILRRGEGMTEEMKPSCSCGWVGIGYEAHNDWQYTLVKDQIDEHLRAVGKAGGQQHG